MEFPPSPYPYSLMSLLCCLLCTGSDGENEAQLSSEPDILKSSNAPVSGRATDDSDDATSISDDVNST